MSKSEGPLVYVWFTDLVPEKLHVHAAFPPPNEHYPVWEKEPSISDADVGNFVAYILSRGWVPGLYQVHSFYVLLDDALSPLTDERKEPVARSLLRWADSTMSLTAKEQAWT